VSEVVLRLGRVAMGSLFEVILRGEDRTQLEAAACEALDEVERLERQLSHYLPASDLCDLHRRAAHEAVRVEPDLFRLLQRAAALSQATDGAFDITAGPLVRCWGFLAKQGRVPAPEEIETALNRVGMRHVDLDEEAQTVRFRQPGIELHLGAIGKGYAVERAARLLRDREVRGALVHGGNSSIAAVGMGPGEQPWHVGLRHPEIADERLAAIALEDCALSTSGSTGDYFEAGGRRYSHLIDPRTGWPAEGLLSVSVVAPSATDSDALSTAFFIMGAQAAEACCARQPGVAAIVVPEPPAGEPLRMLRFGIDFEDAPARA
jgi:FAD:protein FMN transferase